MASYVPVASAVIIGHNPPDKGGALSIGGGGALSGEALHQLDYNGRLGQWEDRGGCDRDMTESDKLYEQDRPSLELGRQLDYVAREGAFEDKGKDQMVDCTYFGQDGALSREEIETDMADSGGAFMKSFVAIDRRYCQELGYTTKQDFENLLRDTWNDAVMEWGITDDPNNIRWFANYHTDAANSLHVHVTTYLADGGLPEGFTVSAAATRRAKSVVYREAYSKLRLQFDKERDWGRDVLQERWRSELGIESDDKLLQRIESKAAVRSYTFERYGQTLSKEAQERIDASKEKIEQHMAENKGSISRDYQLQSYARDIIKELRVSSQPFARAWERYEHLVEEKADLNGYGVEDKPLDDLRAGQKVTYYERESFIRNDMEDLRVRLTNQILKELDPHKELNQAIRDSVKIDSRVLIDEALKQGAGELGLNKADAKELRDVLREPLERENLHRAVELIEKSPMAKQLMDDAATSIEQDCPRFSEEDIQERYASTLERYLQNGIEWRSEKDGLNPDYQMVKSLSRVEFAGGARNCVSEAFERQGIGLGLNLNEYESIHNMAKEAHELLAEGKVEQATPFINGISQIIYNSPEFQNSYTSQLFEYANAEGLDVPELDEACQPQLIANLNDAVQHYCEHMPDENAPIQQQEPQEAMSQEPSPMGAGLIAAALTVAIKGLQREQRASRGDALKKQDKELEQEQSQAQVPTMRQ